MELTCFCGGFSLDDDAAAEADVAIVQYGGLAGSEGADFFGEAKLGASLGQLDGAVY